MLGALQAPGCVCKPHAKHLHRVWCSPTLRRQPKHLQPKPNVATQAARGVQLDLAKNPKAPAPWQLVVFLSAGAMLTCNLHRSVFTMLLPDLTSAHLLTLKDVGVMNSAMLGGYLAGQIPAGFLSDMLGGERVLLVGLLLWSLSLASTGLMPNQLGLIVSRVAMGLFSACAMPATSAMAAKWVPPHIKASTLATIYMLFNMGGVLGLVATPFIGQACGLTSTFMAFGLAGALWAVAGWLCLPSGSRMHAREEVSQIDSYDESGDVAVEGFGGVYHHLDEPGSRGHVSGSSSSSRSSRISSGVGSSSSEEGSDGDGSSSGGRVSSSVSSSSGSGNGVGVSVTGKGGGWNGNGVGLNGGASTSGSESRNGSGNGRGYESVSGNGNGSVATRVSDGGRPEGIHLHHSRGSGSLHGEPAADLGSGSSQAVGMGSRGARGAQAVAEREEEKVVQELPSPSSDAQQQLWLQQAAQPQQQQPQPQPQQQQQQQQRQQEAGPQHPPLLAQISVLCWAHGVMGFGFFIFQSWIPMYLASLGLSSPTSTGLLAGMPWLAAGLVGAVAGNLADNCIRKGIPRLTVRRGAHTISTLGCALCAVPLALGWATTPTAATGWLVLFQSCYAFSFGGFHAYVQDVAQASAGKLLGLTNSCSIALGIVGNLCTGVLVESTGSYSAVFLVTIGLYLTSLAAFFAFLRGTPLELA